MNITEAKKEIEKIIDNVDCTTEESDELTAIKRLLENDKEKENEYEKTHLLGYCKVPKNIDELPRLSSGSANYVAPVSMDCSGLCTRTENQGSLPYCAAFSCSNWAENILWRLSDIPPIIDPIAIYKYAKTIDGDPHGDGTTLTAVLQYLLDKKFFDKNQCSVKVIPCNSNSKNAVKYALHKFGTILGAFNCTSEWYKVNRNKTCISGKEASRVCGGHAVELCGYTKDAVIIHNSWGVEFGYKGFCYMTWDEFDREWLYGAVLSGCLNGLTLNT